MRGLRYLFVTSVAAACAVAVFASAAAAAKPKPHVASPARRSRTPSASA